jgi:hypothetical protein
VFHAISAARARLERWITALQTVPFECPTWYGRQTNPLGNKARQSRDPQLGQLDTGQPAVVSAHHSWAQAVIARRIRTLGASSPHDPAEGRGA